MRLVDVFVVSVTKLQRRWLRIHFNLLLRYDLFWKNCHKCSDNSSRLKKERARLKKRKRVDVVLNVYKHARLRNANHAVKTNRKLNSPFWETNVTRDGRSRYRFGNCQRTIAIKALHHSSSKWITGASRKVEYSLRKAGEAGHCRGNPKKYGRCWESSVENNSWLFHAL